MDKISDWKRKFQLNEEGKGPLCEKRQQKKKKYLKWSHWKLQIELNVTINEQNQEILVVTISWR